MPGSEEYLKAGALAQEEPIVINLAHCLQEALVTYQAEAPTGTDNSYRASYREFFEKLLRAPFKNLKNQSLDVEPFERDVILDFAGFEEMCEQVQKDWVPNNAGESFLESLAGALKVFSNRCRTIAIKKECLEGDNKNSSGICARNFMCSWFKNKVKFSDAVGEQAKKALYNAWAYSINKKPEWFQSYLEQFTQQKGLEDCFTLGMFSAFSKQTQYRENVEHFFLDVCFETAQEARMFFLETSGGISFMGEHSIVTIKNDPNVRGIVGFLNDYAALNKNKINFGDPVALKIVLQGELYQDTKVQEQFLALLESIYRPDVGVIVEIFLENNEGQQSPFAENQLKEKRAAAVGKRKIYDFGNSEADPAAAVFLKNETNIPDDDSGIPQVTYLRTPAPQALQRPSKHSASQDLMKKLNLSMSVTQEVSQQQTEQQEQEQNQEKDQAVRQTAQQKASTTESHQQSSQTSGSGWFDSGKNFNAFAESILAESVKKNQQRQQTSLVTGKLVHKDLYAEIVADPEKAYALAANIMECGYEKEEDGTYTPIFYPCSARSVFMADLSGSLSGLLGGRDVHQEKMQDIFKNISLYKEGMGGDKSIDSAGFLRIPTYVRSYQDAVLKSDRGHEIADRYWTVADFPEFSNLTERQQDLIHELYRYTQLNQEEKMPFLETAIAKFEAFMQEEGDPSVKRWMNVFDDLYRMFPEEKDRILDKGVAILLNQGLDNFKVFLQEGRFFKQEGMVRTFYKNMFYNYEQMSKKFDVPLLRKRIVNHPLKKAMLNGLALHLDHCIGLEALSADIEAESKTASGKLFALNLSQDPDILSNKFIKNSIDSETGFVFLGLSQRPTGALKQIDQFLSLSQQAGYLEEQLDFLKGVSLRDNDALFALEKDGFFVVSEKMEIVASKMDVNKQSYRVTAQEIQELLREKQPTIAATFRMLGAEQRRMPLKRYDKMDALVTTAEEKAFFAWVVANSTGPHFKAAENTVELFTECLRYLRENNMDLEVLLADLLESPLSPQQNWQEKITECLPGFVFEKNKFEQDACTLGDLFFQSKDSAVMALGEYLNNHHVKLDQIFLEAFSSHNGLTFLAENKERIRAAIVNMTKRPVSGALASMMNQFYVTPYPEEDEVEKNLSKRFLYFLVRQTLKDKPNLQALGLSFFSKLYTEQNFEILTQNSAEIQSLLHHFGTVLNKLESTEQAKEFLGALKGVFEKTRSVQSVASLMKVIAQKISTEDLSDFVKVNAGILKIFEKNTGAEVNFLISEKLAPELFNYYVALKKQNIPFDEVYVKVQKMTNFIFKSIQEAELRANPGLLKDLMQCSVKLQDDVLVAIASKTCTVSEISALVEISKSAVDMSVLQHFLSLVKNNRSVMLPQAEAFAKLLQQKEGRSKALCLQVLSMELKAESTAEDCSACIAALAPLGEYELRRILKQHNRPPIAPDFSYQYEETKVAACIAQVFSKQTKKPISQAEQQQILEDYKGVFKLLQKAPGLHVLKDAVLAAKVRECQLILTNPKTGEALKHRTELLMLALSIEGVRRVTGLTPRIPQIVSVISQVLHGPFVCDRIMPGEGKSMVSPLAASMMWAKGVTVDVFTSDPVLVVRDHAFIQEYCDLLGMPCSNVAIDINTPWSESVEGGINVSTASQYALFKALNQAKFSLSVMDPKKRRKKGCVIDENDATLMAATVDNRLAFVMDPLYYQEKEWAVLYEMALDFVKDPHCFGENSCSRTDDIENFKRFTRHQVMQDVALRNKSEGILKLLASISEKQADQLIDAAQIVTHHLKEGKHFSVVEQEDAFVAAPIVNKRPNAAVSWSNFVQQMLHTALNRSLNQEQKTEKRYKVSIVTESVMTISAKEVFADYDYMVGLTGTPGTQKEQQELKETHGMEVYDIPTHGPRRLTKHPSVLAANTKEQCQKIIEQIQGNRPVLIFAENVGAVLALKDELAPWFAEHPEYRLQSYDGVNKEGLEARIVSQAGFPGQVLITTEALGRGTDFGTKDPKGFLGINTGCHMTLRDYDQLENRVARNQYPGEFISIFNQEEFQCPEKVDIETHFASIQREIEDAQQDARVRKVPVRETNKFFREKIIALAYELYQIKLKSSNFEFSEKLYLEGLHEFDKKIYEAWEQYEVEHPVYDEAAARQHLYQVGVEQFSEITGKWFGQLNVETVVPIPPLDLSFFKAHRERFEKVKVGGLQELLSWSELFLQSSGHSKINQIMEKVTKFSADMDALNKGEISPQKYFANLLFGQGVVDKKDLVNGLKDIHVPINATIAEIYGWLTPVVPSVLMRNMPTLLETQQTAVEFSTELTRIFETEDWDAFAPLLQRVQQYFSKFITAFEWLKTANKAYGYMRTGMAVATGGTSLITSYGSSYALQYAFKTLQSQVLSWAGKAFANNDSIVGKIASLFSMVSADEAITFLSAGQQLLSDPNTTLKQLVDSLKQIAKNSEVRAILKAQNMTEAHVQGLLQVMDKYSHLKLVEFFTPEMMLKIGNDIIENNEAFQPLLKKYPDIQARLKKAKGIPQELMDAFKGLNFQDLSVSVSLMFHPQWIAFMQAVPAELRMEDVLSAVLDHKEVQCADPAHTVKLKTAAEDLLQYLNAETTHAEHEKYTLKTLKEQFTVTERNVQLALQQTKRQTRRVFEGVEHTERGYDLPEAFIESKVFSVEKAANTPAFVLPPYTDFIAGAHLKALESTEQDVRDRYVDYLQKALQDPTIKQETLQAVILRVSTDLRQVTEQVRGLEKKRYFEAYQNSAALLLKNYLNGWFLPLSRRQAAEDLLHSINEATDWTQVHDALLQTHADILDVDLSADRNLWRRMLGRMRNKTGTSRLLNQIDNLFLSANAMATASGEGDELEYFETSKQFLAKTVAVVQQRQPTKSLLQVSPLLSGVQDRSWSTLFAVPNILKSVNKSKPMQAVLNHAMVKAPIQYISRSGMSFPANTVKSERRTAFRAPQGVKHIFNMKKITKHFFALLFMVSVGFSASVFFGVSTMLAGIASAALVVLGGAAIYAGVLWKQYHNKVTPVIVPPVEPDLPAVPSVPFQPSRPQTPVSEVVVPVVEPVVVSKKSKRKGPDINPAG